MIITGKEPIKIRLLRDPNNPLETTRWGCIIEASDGQIEFRFEDMSWAEAVTYKNMFEAIHKAALVNKQAFTLTFGVVNNEESSEEDTHSA